MEQQKSGTCITFTELEEFNNITDKIWELENLSWLFTELLDNIVYQQKILGIEATKAALSTLVAEYITRMRIVTEKTILKQKGSTAILRDKAGEHYFYGMYTNAFWDKESEVLTAESHKEFLNWLNTNVDQAPELWTFHEESTARKSRACWWDYSDNFVQMLWPITPKEVKEISTFMDEYTPGMSHGFYTLKQTGGKIEKYRTFEASILPLKYASNPYTNFYIEENKMTDEKYEVLLVTHGKEFADLAREQSSKMTALTDDLSAVEKAFIATKEKETSDESGEVDDEKETSENESEKEPSDENESGEVDDATTLAKTVASLAETVESGFKSLQDIILEQQTQIIAMQEKNVAIAQHQQTFNEGLSTQRVLAKLLQSKSTIGTENNRVLSTSPLAKKGPKQTKVDDSTDITSYMPK